MPLFKRAAGAALEVVIAAGIEAEGGEDSSLPFCKEVARDLVGSFRAATAEGGGRDRASATMFAVPSMCLTSEVRSAMNESCPWTLAVHGSDTL